MESYFPAALVLTVAFAIQFVVDALGGLWPTAPAGAKQLASLAVAAVFVAGTHTDAIADTFGRPPSVAGMICTAVLLAGVASAAVHPAVNAVKATTAAIKAPKAAKKVTK